MQLREKSEGEGGSETAFHRLQEKLTPQVLGLLWITGQDIAAREAPFSDLNYFFDGILGRRIFSAEASLADEVDGAMGEGVHLVASEHYQRPVYLGQVKWDDPRLSAALNQFLRIMQGRANGRKKVLVALKQRSHFPPSVAKSNPSMEFEFLFF